MGKNGWIWIAWYRRSVRNGPSLETSDRSAFLPANPDCFREEGWQFFHSSWAAMPLWGCRLSGASLRQPFLCQRLYVDAGATLRPSRCPRACLISLTTRIPPALAFSMSSATTWSSGWVYSPSRMKPVRNRQAQLTDTPIALAVSSRLSPNSNGRTTAWGLSQLIRRLSLRHTCLCFLQYLCTSCLDVHDHTSHEGIYEPYYIFELELE